MKKFVFHLLVLLTIFSSPVYSQSPTDFLREAIRSRIEALGLYPEFVLNDDLIYSRTVLPKFYEQRLFRPAWVTDQRISPMAFELDSALESATENGLRPSDYHFERIKALMDEIDWHHNFQLTAPMVNRLLELELLLTDAYLIYGSHLLNGKVDPINIDAEWIAERKTFDFAAYLEKALQNGNIRQSLDNLLPMHPGYDALRKALVFYRKQAAEGGWPTIPDGPKLEKGVKDPRVILLRQRLAITGDFNEAMTTDSLFDDALENAVRKFQRRHGLDIDGVVGKGTLEALNVSAAQRVNMIIVNLERWRWLPLNLGRKYVLVNIADFSLAVFEDEIAVMDMRVIVGRDYRRTPVFSGKMTYLVFCPFWHVPPTIAVQDILPQVKKDPGYLKRQNMKVFEGWGADSREIDPATIDWHKVNAANFRFRFRQDPGPNNALGKVKFMFPNQFNVYLHDTPARELFSRTVRTFSSGCIRLEKPLELAEYLLKGTPLGNRNAINEIVAKWQEKTVRLPEAVPIHLLYWTAWQTDEGTVHFRKDIYNRDTPLLNALLDLPPNPGEIKNE